MATTGKKLTADAWENLGTVPCFVQMVGQNPVAFVIDTAAPATLDAAAFTLSQSGERSADVGLTGQNLYARSLGPNGAEVRVAR